VLSKKNLVLPALVVALTATMASPAEARQTLAPRASSEPAPLHFSAALSGAAEVATGGDPDGSAKGRVDIKGNRVSFAFTWKHISTPTMAHIHIGGSGANGDVKVPLFTSPLPDNTSGVAGVVELADADLVTAIASHPDKFYLNLHTAEFPAGAVRGQLGRARRHRSALDLLPGLPLQALSNGAAEVPVAGDPDGHGHDMIRASGRRIKYTVSWAKIDRPTMAHLHLGAAGTSGPLVVPLFEMKVPEHVFALTGVVRHVDKSLVTSVRHAPTSYYVNVHNDEFPGGALRGQLHSEW
jgi:hypothetical protein